jgi:hypothetical protein
MFSTVYCFFPIFFFIFQAYLLKKRKSLVYEIKKGQICYNCKVDLNVSEKDTWDRLMKSEDFSKLCISCSRDKKLSLLKNPLLVWKYKLQKNISSNKFDKNYWLFIPLVFLFITLDIIFMFYGVKMRLWFIYGSLNIIWWLMITYKTYYTTQKKPSE